MRRIYSPNLPWRHDEDIKEMYESIHARLAKGELNEEIALMIIETLKDWWHKEGEIGSPLNMLQHDFCEMFNSLQEEKLLNNNTKDSNKEQVNMAVDTNKIKNGIYSYFQRCDDIRDQLKFRRLLFHNQK